MTTTHNLTYQECIKHTNDYLLRGFRKDAICGCPRTTRTSGLLVYKCDIGGDWVVWDCSGQTWLGRYGRYETALNGAMEYIRNFPHTPIRCETRCSQWPNCTHDWRSWRIVVPGPWEA